MKSIAMRLLGLGLLGPALCLGCHYPRQRGSNDYYWFPRASVAGGPTQAASGPQPSSQVAATPPRSSYLPPQAPGAATQPVPYAQAAKGSPYSQVPAHLTVPEPQAPAAVAKAPDNPSSPPLLPPSNPPRPPLPEMLAAATPSPRPQPPIDPYPVLTPPSNGPKAALPTPVMPTITPPPAATPPPPLVPPAGPVTTPPVPAPAQTPPTPAVQTGGYGHASDYSWLSGQVEQTHRGLRLRYAALDERDTYGGSVGLLADSHADSLKEGQFVRVLGHLVNAVNRTSVPAYKVLAVEPASR